MSKSTKKSATPSPIPVLPVRPDLWDKVAKNLDKAERAWASLHDFTGKPGSNLAIPDGKGGIGKVLYGLGEGEDIWRWASLAKGLPGGTYKLDGDISEQEIADAHLAVTLDQYAFTRFKADTKTDKKPVMHPSKRKGAAAIAIRQAAAAEAEAVTLVRDLINCPAEYMGPTELSETVQALAGQFGADFEETVGDALLDKGYRLIHAVGRAAEKAPRLIDLKWGDSKHPKITLVGKGVCFDTGGLDLKPAAAMRLMKKDMGGAANVLGLASLIMAAELPVRLRVLIPAVENNVAGNAFRPGDVIESYKGISVEIGNTDAEGRLVLCDALALADEESPNLLIDCATLTGAARVALGPELPALFTDNRDLANDLMETGMRIGDPVWHLPLWQPYLKRMDSPVADTNNISDGPFAGAITAALFLQRFVSKSKSWMHIDLFGWNDKARPGRPAGGEAQSIRAVFAMLKSHYGNL